MGLESVTVITDLNSSWPLGGDDRVEGDNHLRIIKVALKSLLTNVNQIGVGPASLSGQAGKALIVNEGEDGFDELATLYTDAEAIAACEGIVDDTPVDAATDQPVSSNWAYDHENNITAHHAEGAVLTYETPSGTINGSNKTFTLSQTPDSAASLHVFRQGVMLKLTTHYTRSGSTLTFASAPLTGDWLWAFYET